MFRRIGFLVLIVFALLSVLGVAPSSTAVAVNIATVLLTLALPFIPLAHLPFSGKQMVAISMVAAFILAVIANVITGDLKASDLGGGVLPLLEKFALVWGGTQAVFQLFKDSVPALTTAPILVAPPAAPKPAA